VTLQRRLLIGGQNKANGSPSRHAPLNTSTP
jgi:hypothetical protein